MARTISARRYSQAVFEIALETNRLEQWQADIQKMTGVLSDGAILAWLESPRVRFDDKVRLLSENLKDVSPQALNLLRLLVSKDKTTIIGGIAGEYERLVDRHHGIERAEVITAISLDEQDQQKLAAKLGAIIGKKIVLKATVDPAVIGGVIARIDGKLLDASTRSQLEALSREIAGGGALRAGKETD